MEILKVSSKSNCNSVAGALANIIRQDKPAGLQAIGAGAVNQAMKSIAIARGFLTPSGIEISCVPSFITINIEDVEKTGMNFIIQTNKN